MILDMLNATYTVRPSSEHWSLWEVEPSDAGMTRDEVDLEFCVTWGELVEASDGTRHYDALTWEYVNDPEDTDLIMA